MKRNYGIDLLRLLLMVMVLVLHILYAGGVLMATEVLSPNYNAAWLLETMAYCAVDCYVIITGYVHMNSKFRFSSYILLWLQVLTYSVGIAACVWLIRPASFSLRSLAYFLTPVSHNLFWFFSAYTGLFVLIPFLNAAIQTIPRHLAAVYLGIVLAVLMLVSLFTYTDPFALKGGYSVMWFAMLYLIGACIREHKWEQIISVKKAIGIYFLCVLLSWGEKLIRDFRVVMLGGAVEPSGILISYISPTILIAAIALFLAFCNIRLNDRISNLVRIFSPAAFGVYLIHTHECVGIHIITEKYAFLADWGVLAMVGGVIGIAVLIFTVCLMIDWIRLRMFSLLGIKRILEKTEQKLVSGGRIRTERR